MMAETDIPRCATRTVWPYTAANHEQLRISDIRDWSRFWGRVTTSAAKDEPSPGKRLWELLDEETKRLIEAAGRRGKLTAEERRQAVNALNAVLSRSDFYDERYFPVTLPLSSPMSKMLPWPWGEMQRPKGRELDDREVFALNRAALDLTFADLIRRPDTSCAKYSAAHPLFGSGDILNWPQFCGKLVAARDDAAPGPARRLWQLLPEEHRATVASVTARGTAAGRERRSLAGALNRIIQYRYFDGGTSFADAALGEADSDLRRCDPEARSEREVLRLNRALIDASFPHLTAPKNWCAQQFTDGLALGPWGRMTQRGRNAFRAARRFCHDHATRVWGYAIGVVAIATLCGAVEWVMASRGEKDISAWWLFSLLIAFVSLSLLVRLSPPWGGLIAMVGLFLAIGLGTLVAEVAPSTPRASRVSALVFGWSAAVGALWVWCAFVREWRHMADKIRRLEEQVAELRDADARDKAEAS